MAIVCISCSRCAYRTVGFAYRTTVVVIAQLRQRIEYRMNSIVLCAESRPSYATYGTLISSSSWRRRDRLRCINDNIASRIVRLTLKANSRSLCFRVTVICFGWIDHDRHGWVRLRISRRSAIARCLGGYEEPRIPVLCFSAWYMGFDLRAGVLNNRLKIESFWITGSY